MQVEADKSIISENSQLDPDFKEKLLNNTINLHQKAKKAMPVYPGYESSVDDSVEKKALPVVLNFTKRDPVVYEESSQQILETTLSKAELLRLTRRNKKYMAEAATKNQKQKQILKVINSSQTSFILPFRQKDNERYFKHIDTPPAFEPSFLKSEQIKYDNQQIYDSLEGNNTLTETQWNSLHKQILNQYDQPFFDQKFKMHKKILPKLGKSLISTHRSVSIGNQTKNEFTKKAAIPSAFKTCDNFYDKCGRSFSLKNQMSSEKQGYQLAQQQMNFTSFNNSFGFNKVCNEKVQNLQLELDSNRQQKQYVNHFYTSLTKFGDNKIRDHSNKSKRNKQLKSIRKFVQFVQPSDESEELIQQQKQKNLKFSNMNPEGEKATEFFIFSSNQDMSLQWAGQSRESCQMVELNKKIYIYGGVGNELINVMSELCLDKMTWKHFTDPLEEGRYGHTMLKYKGQLVVFGGQSNYNNTIKQRECLSDVRLFDLQSHSFQKARCSGEIPEPTAFPAACLFESRYLLIHGGLNSKTIYLSSLFLLDLNNFKWEQIEYSSLSADALYPDGVAFHQMVHVQKDTSARKVSFGMLPAGLNDSNILEEGVYTFGGKCRQKQYDYPLMILKRNSPGDKVNKSLKFTVPVTSGIPPSSRVQHQMSHNYMLNILVIYGGKSAQSESEQQMFFSSLSILCLHNLNWIQVVDRSALPVQSKAAHCLLSFDTQLIIFGGYNLNGLISNHVQTIQLNQKKVQNQFRSTNTAGHVLEQLKRSPVKKETPLAQAVLDIAMEKITSSRQMQQQNPIKFRSQMLQETCIFNN